MPEVNYDLKVAADEDDPVEMQIVSYDSEGENLAGVVVRLEMESPQGSFAADEALTRLSLVTNSRGKAYFAWHRRPQDAARADVVVELKATWEGLDPFVFIERFRETWHGGV